VVKKDREADLVRVWIFGNDGFTLEAEKFMSAKAVFWSTREDLDGLLEYVNLRRLPPI